MSRVKTSLRALLRLMLVIGAAAATAVTVLVVLEWQARSDETVRVIEVPYLGGSGAITTGRVIFVH